MKPRSVRLKVVLDLAARKEEQALGWLKQARLHWMQQRDQLQSLQIYHQNTIQDLKTSHDNLHRADRLQSYQQFIAHVDHAIRQQQGIVDDAARRVDKATEVWKQCHQKRKGMQDLIDRYSKEESLAMEKMEQKLAEDSVHSRLAYRSRR